MTLSPNARYFTWLIFFCFLLFPFRRTVELPMLIMTIGGGVLAYQYGRPFFQAPAIKLFTLLFACIWLPMLLSVPDSYALEKSASTGLTFIRLYLSGLFIIWVMSDQKQASLLIKLLAGLTAFWVVDALFQAATGHDFFGYAQRPDRLNGVFGERSLRLGNALPVLAPFLILALRKRLALMLLATATSGAVVILAGSRGGWVSFGLVCVWLILSETRRRGVPLWKAGVVAALIALVGTFAAFENPGARQRLDQTLLLFSGDEAKIDQALSYRWTLWKDAFAMIDAHPVNGVGVRAFRYAYPEFAQPDDPFLSINEASGRPTGAFYAHQIIMEVTAETGLIGLAGLGLFYVLLVRSWRLASHERRIQSLPFAMAALAWIFPFNTHPSFYTAQWSVLIWLIIAMLCASLLPLQKTGDTANRSLG
ncbi:MAG: O-antigen ligase family protein [Gammaproteobacteria bacterium]|nr:O-antigen ligase family protein [Gammaproteobacteria bacterium]